MVTMAQSVTDCRSQLDETNVNNQYWTSPEIRVWINDGVRDIARRTETILTYTTALSAVVGVPMYLLPSDVIRVHRVEFIPMGSTQKYPVQGSTYEELDQLWGINPETTSSYPSAFCIWGTPGSLTIRFYPVPAQVGTFAIYYYQMPVNLNTDGTDDARPLSIPSGWDDMVVMYVTYRGLMKARDPEWQVAKHLYEDQIQNLVDVTREMHDQGRFISTQTGSYPNWLYAWSDE